MVSSPSQLLKRAAIAQLCSGSSKFKNLTDIAKCAGWAKRDGASMLFLPEGFGFLGRNADETVQNAEELIDAEGDKCSTSDKTSLEHWHKSLMCTVQSCATDLDRYANVDSPMDTIDNNEISLIRGLQTIAKESGLWISGGGMHIRGAPPSELDDYNPDHPQIRRERVYNTHIIMNNEGKIMASYRKIHLFDVSIPSQNLVFRESSYAAPGDKLVLCDSPVGMLGLSTCFDLRFPEFYSQLRQGGAEVLLVPSAFTVPTGKAHWHTLLRARAIETQCYVIAAAQYGKHNEKRESYGHSLSIDPWGEIISDSGGCDNVGTTVIDGDRVSVPSIALCDIDNDLIAAVRERMPLHRRPFSVYSFQ